MNNDTLAREINHEGPAWATDRRDSGDGGLPWFAAPVGRGYLVAGLAHDSCDLQDSDAPMTFELLTCPNESVSGPETYIDQDCGLGGVNAVFASAYAMRRYARILLEVADDVDRVTGGAR